jgi:hypothetical protein
VIRAEKHVAAGEHLTTVFHCSEIHLVLQTALAMPFRYDVAVRAQARHTAVGINVESQMAEGMWILDGEEILAVAFQLRLRQHLQPLRLQQRIDVRLRWQ